MKVKTVKQKLDSLDRWVWFHIFRQPSHMTWRLMTMGKSNMFYPVLLSLFSGVLLACTLPNPIFPMGLGVLGIFALVPLFLAIYECRRSREAILYGFLFGLSNSLLSNFWLFFYKGFAWVTLGGASLGVGLLCMSIAAYVFMLRKQTPFLRAFLVAIAWAVYELGKSNGFLGFPWGLIAYATYQWLPFIQVVDIFGIVIMSFTMALFNAFITEWILASRPFLRRDFMIQAIISVAIVVVFLVYGMTQLHKKIEPGIRANILLVQHNDDPWATQDNSLHLYQQLVQQSLLANENNFDLIVGSEGVLPYPYEKDLLFYKMIPHEDYSFDAFLESLQKYQIIGSPLPSDSGNEQNGVVFLGPTGDLLDIYAKRQLVPFAEYNPFLGNPIGYWFFDKVIGYPFSWAQGQKNTLFSLPIQDQNILLGVPICFEDAFGWVSRDFVFAGADLLVNVTNNSWSKTISAQHQHLAAARYRSIENRRPLIRATTSGDTAYIDAYGRIIAQIDPFISDVLVADVQLPAKKTFTLYTIAGDYLGWAFFIFMHIYLIWSTYFLYGRANWRIVGLLRLGLYDAELNVK